jgi:outer membrane protein
MGMQLRLGITMKMVLLVGALLITFNASAQVTSLKIGVINSARLGDQAPQTQAVLAELQDEFAPRQREIAATQQLLQEKQETYERDGAVMGETERFRLERELREEARDWQRAQDEYIEDLNIRRNEALGALQSYLLQEVQIYATDAGYDLVVGEALYFSPAVDITDDVLLSLQAAYEGDDGGS